MSRFFIGISKEHWVALTVFLVGGILQVVVGLSAVAFFQRLLDSIASAQQFADVLGILPVEAG